MAHEILSEKIDEKNLEFVQDYCDANLAKKGELVPAWVACKLISFLRLNYDFSRVDQIAAVCEIDYVRRDEKYLLLAEYSKQISQSRDLDRLLGRFDQYKFNVEGCGKWGFYPDFFESLSRARKSGTGFSFVRLGDGEGNTLALNDAYKDPGIRDWSKKIFDLQFGDVRPLPFSDQRHIGKLIEGAALNADFLGVIRPATLKLKIDARTWPADRQLHGNLICLEYVSENLATLNKNSKLTDSSVHKDPVFIRNIFEFFRGESVATFIGPHSEIMKIAREFEFKSSVFICVPGEFKYFGPGAHHYFDCFDLISQAIRPAYQGAPFFVGAGLLGKYYCDLAKQRGGVGIDIGSAMDDLCGFTHTRSA